MALFPAHSNAPWFFSYALWLLFSSSFAFEMGRYSQSQRFQRGEHGSLNFFKQRLAAEDHRTTLSFLWNAHIARITESGESTSSGRVMLPKRALGALLPLWPVSNDTDQETHSLHSCMFIKYWGHFSFSLQRRVSIDILTHWTCLLSQLCNEKSQNLQT